MHHSLVQLLTLSAVFFNITIASSIVSPTDKIAVSSAYVATTVSVHCGRSLVKRKFRTSARALPCGIPALILFNCEYSLPYVTPRTLSQI